MANTVDENLRKHLIDDSTVSNLVGGRVHENHAPQTPKTPYIWFRIAGTDQERTLGDSAPNTPFRYRFDLECWSSSIAGARTIAEAVFSRLDSYRGAFGDSTVKGIFVEQQPDDYEPLGASIEDGLHVASQSVEVIP